jgi:hypothetical protein
MISLALGRASSVLELSGNNSRVALLGYSPHIFHFVDISSRSVSLRYQTCAFGACRDVLQIRTDLQFANK